MNKTELVDMIATKSGLSKADSQRALDSTIDSIYEALANDDSVALVGFGTFSVAERAARTGRNPQTGAPIEIPAAKIVKFKGGNKLKEAVN